MLGPFRSQHGPLPALLLGGLLACSVPAAAGTDGSRNLSLEAFLQLVRSQNDRIRSAELDYRIAEEAMRGARAAFEVALVGNVRHEENQVRNTVQEALQRGSLTEFQEFNNRYDTAVESRIPTGGRFNFGYRLDALNNSLQRAGARGDSFNEFRTFVGGTFDQPLLRGRGHGSSLAAIRIAQAERDVAFQSFRLQLLQIAAESAAAYLDLRMAEERREIRSESVRISEALLTDNQERVKLGMLAETEVLEAQAGLALRKSLELAASQNVVEAMNRLRRFLVESAGTESAPIHATTPLVPREFAPDLDARIARARERAPEYLAALARLRRERVRLRYAENQDKPQVDFQAGFGVNGLDSNPSDSFDDAFTGRRPTWHVLVSTRIPLDGDRQAGSEVRAARHREEQTHVAIDATLVDLANALDTSSQNVLNARRQVDYYHDVVMHNEQLMKVERERFDVGMSDSRLVLDREERLIKAREDELQSLVNFEKAVLDLDAREGSLLERFGIEAR